MRTAIIFITVLGLTQWQTQLIERHWIDYDPAGGKTITIRLSPILADGSDATCHAAGRLFFSILQKQPAGTKLRILPSVSADTQWVPVHPKNNPLTFEESVNLAQGY